MGFNWQDIPPTVVGTTSYFGQQPLLSTNDITGMGFPDMVQLGMPMDRLPTTSADVLEAATLLQNSHNRPHNTSNGYATQDLSMSMAPHHTTQSTQGIMPYNEPRLRPAPPKQDDFGDTYYAELMFGPAAGNGRPTPKGPPKNADIHWGSDAGFGSGQGFIAPPGQVSIEQIEQKLIHVVECVEAKGSTAASTGPNSPVAVRYAEPPRRQSEQVLNGHEHGEYEDDSRSRKRRKNKMKEDDDEDDEDSIAAKGPRKRKAKCPAPPPSSVTAQSAQPSKRRKSGASSATKPHRENLTEDQKRENHIKSEQKRRTLIKEGFDDLNELVPDLRGGGHSKSVVLVMAADWLEDLIEGNKVLRARLQELEDVTESNTV